MIELLPAWAGLIAVAVWIALMVAWASFDVSEHFAIGGIDDRAI